MARQLENGFSNCRATFKKGCIHYRNMRNSHHLSKNMIVHNQSRKHDGYYGKQLD